MQEPLQVRVWVHIREPVRVHVYQYCQQGSSTWTRISSCTWNITSGTANMSSHARTFASSGMRSCTWNAYRTLYTCSSVWTCSCSCTCSYTCNWWDITSEVQVHEHVPVHVHGISHRILLTRVHVHVLAKVYRFRENLHSITYTCSCTWSFMPENLQIGLD